MVLGSEYVTMPSCASAALSPIGLCKVVLRAGSRAGTVTEKIYRRCKITLMIEA